MIPLTMGETNEEEGLIDIRSYKKMKHSMYWNIAFYHTRTQAYHLLDESRKMLIYEIDTQAPEQKSGAEVKHIFYQIITTDANKDNRFNSGDLTYLFVSDRTGRNFYQLSPSDYDLISYKRLKASTKAVMLVRKDSNGNHKYDREDEQMAFIVDLADKSPAKEIFTQEGKQKIKELFDRDWKKVK